MLVSGCCQSPQYYSVVELACGVRDIVRGLRPSVCSFSRAFVRRHSEIQSTLVISKSKGPSNILRDIRTSTYQICRIEEKINKTTTFHK